jgi:hypothetical protein
MVGMGVEANRRVEDGGTTRHDGAMGLIFRCGGRSFYLYRIGGPVECPNMCWRQTSARWLRRYNLPPLALGSSPSVQLSLSLSLFLREKNLRSAPRRFRHVSRRISTRKRTHGTALPGGRRGKKGPWIRSLGRKQNRINFLSRKKRASLPTFFYPTQQGSLSPKKKKSSPDSRARADVHVCHSSLRINYLQAHACDKS